jgi:anti-sigma regulatory factor (Ser/Thr protein kinase)
LSVPPHPLSVGFVRKAVSAAASVKGQELSEVVALIFSELITNTVRHSKVPLDARIEVSLSVNGHGIKGSVGDNGVGFEPADVDGPHEEGGYGLVILDRLVKDWGVESAAGRTTVWFEI